MLSWQHRPRFRLRRGSGFPGDPSRNIRRFVSIGVACSSRSPDPTHCSDDSKLSALGNPRIQELLKRRPARITSNSSLNRAEIRNVTRQVGSTPGKRSALPSRPSSPPVALTLCPGCQNLVPARVVSKDRSEQMGLTATARNRCSR